MSRAQTDKIVTLVEPIVSEEGCELLDVNIVVEHGAKVLRIFVDKEGGVQLADCSRISHAVEDLLEVEDAVAGRYNLEVSSPGLDRPLRFLKHFEQAVGQVVSVTTKEKVNGRKRYKGLLKKATSETLLIEIDQQDFEVPFIELAKGHLVYDSGDAARS